MPQSKEEIRQYQKEYREKNKEKRKEYLEKNKDKIKEYNQKPHIKKIMRISQWKHIGIISENFDELYEKFINTKFCELCSVELTEEKITTKTHRCLDHDHSITEYNNVRNILCHSCNVKRR